MGAGYEVFEVMNERAALVLEIIRSKPEGILSKEFNAACLKVDKGLYRSKLNSVIQWLVNDGYVAIEKINPQLYRYYSLISDHWVNRVFVLERQFPRPKHQRIANIEVVYTDLPDETARFSGHAKCKPKTSGIRYNMDNFTYMSSGQTCNEGGTYGVSPVYAEG